MEPEWDSMPVLEDLKTQATDLDNYGIEDFCKGAIDVLAI